MDFDSYQIEARKTAIYPNKDKNFIYPTLGLVGESGEVAEKIKKVLRDKNGNLDDDSKSALKKELGDVLWYLSNLSDELGFTLNDIAKVNLEKLNLRLSSGKISGSGDDR
tara:strand:- start:407 stop:736 length:330 start_codon:yes stop_codon:yes gene_type:complete